MKLVAGEPSPLSLFRLNRILSLISYSVASLLQIPRPLSNSLHRRIPMSAWAKSPSENLSQALKTIRYLWNRAEKGRWLTEKEKARGSFKDLFVIGCVLLSRLRGPAAAGAARAAARRPPATRSPGVPFRPSRRITLFGQMVQRWTRVFPIHSFGVARTARLRPPRSLRSRKFFILSLTRECQTFHFYEKFWDSLA